MSALSSLFGTSSYSTPLFYLASDGLHVMQTGTEGATASSSMDTPLSSFPPAPAITVTLVPTGPGLPPLIQFVRNDSTDTAASGLSALAASYSRSPAGLIASLLFSGSVLDVLAH